MGLKPLSLLVALAPSALLAANGGSIVQVYPDGPLLVGGQYQFGAVADTDPDDNEELIAWKLVVEVYEYDGAPVKILSSSSTVVGYEGPSVATEGFWPANLQKTGVQYEVRARLYWRHPAPPNQPWTVIFATSKWVTFQD